jgi:GAF domain-containing protein
MLLKMLRERMRSKAVAGLETIGTPAEPGVHRFTEQASQAFAAPISLLTLIHDDRLWVKASTGLDVQCLPKQDGFCTYVVERADMLEVCDALADPLFRTLPPVTGDPYLRYYIGAPLTLASGMDVGALCVLDIKPREPASRDQRAYLSSLARQAATMLEHRARTKSSLAA